MRNELVSYLGHARAICVEFQTRIHNSSDLIIDGNLSIDEIVEMIRAEIEYCVGED